jgi:hypothetical protein
MSQLHLDGPALMGGHVDREPIALSRLPGEATYATALAVWMVDRMIEPHRPAGLGELVDSLEWMKIVQAVGQWRTALVLSNEDRDRLLAVVKGLAELGRWGQWRVAKRKRLMARGEWREMWMAWRAVAGLMVEETVDWAAMEEEMAELEREGVSPEPLITGDDLVGAGYKPGPTFKRVLDEVYDAQLEGRLSDRDGAMAMVRGMF